MKIFPLIQSNGWILVPLVSIIWLDFEFGIFLFPCYIFSGGLAILMFSSFIIYQIIALRKCRRQYRILCL